LFLTDDDWVKAIPRGRPKRTWREVVREDCQAHKLNTEDAVDRSKWRKLIKDINTKNCSLSIVLTATDQKPQKSLKR